MDNEYMVKAAAVIEEMGRALQATAQERDEAVAKCAQYERRQTAEKLASHMVERGLSSDPVADLADHLEKAASQGEDLSQLRRAVDLVGPDMGRKFASLKNNDDASGSAGPSAFEKYILGQAG